MRSKLKSETKVDITIFLLACLFWLSLFLSTWFYLKNRGITKSPYGNFSIELSPGIVMRSMLNDNCESSGQVIIKNEANKVIFNTHDGELYGPLDRIKCRPDYIFLPKKILALGYGFDFDESGLRENAPFFNEDGSFAQTFTQEDINVILDHNDLDKKKTFLFFLGATLKLNNQELIRLNVQKLLSYSRIEQFQDAIILASFLELDGNKKILTAILKDQRRNKIEPNLHSEIREMGNLLSSKMDEKRLIAFSKKYFIERESDPAGGLYLIAKSKKIKIDRKKEIIAKFLNSKDYSLSNYAEKYLMDKETHKELLLEHLLSQLDHCVNDNRCYQSLFPQISRLTELLKKDNGELEYNKKLNILIAKGLRHKESSIIRESFYIIRDNSFSNYSGLLAPLKELKYNDIYKDPTFAEQLNSAIDKVISLRN